MNIYTLHKAGSFRPPSLDCDSEIDHSQSTREKLPRPNLEVVTEEKKRGSDTSDTSRSEHSSSLGEKTTPRHNVTPNATHTFANNVANNTIIHNGPRNSASRIDATGLITETNLPQVLSSKAAFLDAEAKVVKPKKVKSSNSSSRFKHVKRVTPGLIHIQAKDEFMIFEDNTDLVSHITTPSAVRTSPLETDYLIIDHDEFAEEESLFSAITVPKALRKKKNRKKSSKSRSKGTKNSDVEKEALEIINTLTEGGMIKVAPSASNDSESVEVEKQKQHPPVSPPKLMRQNSLELHRTSSHSGSEKSGSRRSVSRRSDLRGGRRSDKSLTPTKSREAKDLPSQDHQEERLPIPTLLTPSSELEQQQQAQDETKSELPYDETSKTANDLIPVVTSPKSPQEEDASKTSQSVSKGESTDLAPEKPLAFKLRVPEHDTNTEQQQDDTEKSPESEDINNSTSSSPRKNLNLQEGIQSVVPEEANRSKTQSPKKPLFGVDGTARTVNEGSNEGSSSRHFGGSSSSNCIEESPVESPARKIPNSRQRKKSFTKWLLPTSCFGCPRTKNRHSEGVTDCPGQTFPHER